jgi:D-alanyl-D-alanine carboxypeptidase
MNDRKDVRPKHEVAASSVPDPSDELPEGDLAAPGGLRNRVLILAVVVLAAILTTLVLYGVASGATPESPPDGEDPLPDEEVTDHPSGELPEDGDAATEDLPPQEDEPQAPYEYACDVSAYLDAIAFVQAKEDVLLLNKNNAKSVTYVPDALLELDASQTFYGKKIELDATTAAALSDMLLCMRADGITDTFVTSGYRSYKYQSTLFSDYVRQEMAKDASLSEAEAIAKASTYSARAGQSEHQSGLCVDLITTSMGSLNRTFENTKAFAWLRENAAQFGFILRYPEGKEHITGYIYEPWHYRFVGREAALEISANGLTLEEYLGRN